MEKLCDGVHEINAEALKTVIANQFVFLKRVFQAGYYPHIYETDTQQEGKQMKG